MGKTDNGHFKKLKVSREDIQREFGIDLYLFLDAVALGLNDEEIADIVGFDTASVKKVRQKLGDVTSGIGITYKKDFPS